MMVFSCDIFAVIEGFCTRYVTFLLKMGACLFAWLCMATPEETNFRGIHECLPYVTDVSSMSLSISRRGKDFYQKTPAFLVNDSSDNPHGRGWRLGRAV